MGSMTSSGAVKKKSVKAKKDSGKKKAARKTAAKKTRSRATAVKKKAAAPKKTARKKVTAKKKAPIKKASARTKSAKKPGKRADTGPTANPASATATDAAEGDTKSLSWMAAQAASALKAVKANQNERAQTLLAKAEITPATPVKPGEEAGTRTEPDLSEAKKATKAAKTKPARAGKKAVKEPSADIAVAPTAPEAPASTKPETTQAVLPAATGDSGDQPADTPPAHVIAATATGSRRSIRPFLLTGIIVLIGVLGARAWFSNDDTADIAAIQEGAEAEQVSPVTARPQISVVASEPAVKPATDATQADSWSPATMSAWPEPADTRQTVAPAPPETSISATKVIDTQQQQVMTQTIEPTSPETSINETKITETPQQQVVTQTTAAAAKTVSPPAPRPGYHAPAYGYYPRQPVRQQPYYYQRTYSRPAYSR
jgi:hypothetical protein